MKKIILTISVALSFAGCLKIDSNLYNTSQKIEQYLWDAYPEQGEFILDESYKIDKDSINLFTLTSNDAGDQAKIYAVYIGDMSRIQTDTVILYHHGNKWHMDWYWQRAKLLANIGKKHRFGVLMYDYRGYGLSEGTPTESGMYADANACVDWLKSKGLTDNRLVMYGYSLGSAAATKLTANGCSVKPSRLILESPFASAETMLQDAAGGLSLPGSYITDLEIDNAEEIKKVQQPFLWIHGEKDDFLRIESHGQVVFNNYQGTKGVAKPIPDANHSNIPIVMTLDTYKQTILDFMTK